MHVEWQVLLANYFGRLALGRVVSTRHSLFSISIQYSVYSALGIQYSSLALTTSQPICVGIPWLCSHFYSPQLCLLCRKSVIFTVLECDVFYLILRMSLTYEYLETCKDFLYSKTMLIMPQISHM